MTHEAIEVTHEISFEETGSNDSFEAAALLDNTETETTAWSAEAEDDAIRNARQGDPHAFQRLYENYSSYVYHRCLRLTGDPGMAEDLRQEVFVQVWKGISKFRGDSKFKTWLYRVATNMAYMYLRRTQCRPKMEQYNPLAEDVEIEEEKISSHLFHPEDGLLLGQAMKVLAPKHRAVLVLHDCKGYKHTEIATILGIPCGTSKSILFRARREVRSALQHWRKRSSGSQRGETKVRYAA